MPRHPKCAMLVVPQVSISSDDVSRRIREARIARGWTHEELARRMGVNWRTVQRWQSGKVPRVHTLMRLADVLGVPEGYLLQSRDTEVTLAELRDRLDELSSRLDRLTATLDGLLPDPIELRASSGKG